MEKGSVGIQVREVRKVDKGRRKISALLSFVSFSKLVILVYTGQPVENNTAYARYNLVAVGESYEEHYKYAPLHEHCEFPVLLKLKL